MWIRPLAGSLIYAVSFVAPLSAVADDVASGRVSIQRLAFQEPAASPQSKPAPVAAPPKPDEAKPENAKPSAPKAQPGAAVSKPQPANPAEKKPDTPPAGKQPEPVPAARPQTSPFSGLRMPSGRRSFLARLNRTPDLFGDIPTLSISQVSSGSMSSSNPVVSVPLGGATRRFKNEQSRALPTDRVFAFFNHFHNAQEISGFGGSVTEDINQFTLGAEQTFGDGDWSFEIRLPIATETDFGNQFNRAQSDGLGNLAVTLKKLLYADDDLATAIGLAVTAPTGDDANVTYFDFNLRIENEAVHLLPYLAMQYAPDDNWFFHAFAQIDVAANGDGIRAVDTFNNQVSTGRTVEQTLMFLDVAAGYWWLRTDAPDSSGLTGVASVLELHYSTALNDSDSTDISVLTVGNRDNRFDVVNLTAGLHTEWNRDTALRLATVVPLRDSGENRLFDFEVQVTIVKRIR